MIVKKVATAGDVKAKPAKRGRPVTKDNQLLRVLKKLNETGKETNKLLKEIRDIQDNIWRERSP